jgi:two-component SAPR family response regulator
MKIIEAIIIDDEPTAIENLEYLLADMDSIKVQKTFTSPTKALDCFFENPTALIFIDV